MSQNNSNMAALCKEAATALNGTATKIKSALLAIHRSLAATTDIQYPTQDELREREFRRIERNAQERVTLKLDNLYREFSKNSRPAARRRGASNASAHK
jgi:Tfp pilus assembly PilM family ATPase